MFVQRTIEIKWLYVCAIVKLSNHWNIPEKQFPDQNQHNFVNGFKVETKMLNAKLS